MTESADLDQIAKLVKDAAEESGTMILETALVSESLPGVAVSGDRFPALIKHLRPRLVYMLLTSFDAEAAVEGHFEVDELDSDLNKLAAKWRKRNGQTARLILGFMADGILHAIIETTVWFDEFEEEAEQLEANRAERLQADFDRRQEEERSQREAEEKKRLTPYVKKLVADERFNAPKISAAKRLALAETMFINLDRASTKKAVDRAVNELWLTGTGK
ncbi:hypothetical protein GOD34_29020 [Sinorhizobium medicae]|nr:hypothetical protein [Sinorhizobium medicae]